jgi:exodeoxyribonuclease V alpha subunit
VELVRQAVADLIHAEVLIREGNALYFKVMRDAEERVAAKIRVLAARRLHQDPGANIDGLIARAETDQGFPYHEKQREAVRVALTSGFSVISGGPGTGKTTISKAIVEAYKSLDHTKPVYLCAPTGRAAKRLSEMTGTEAATIHRMLGYRPMGEGWVFAFDETNTLEAGLLLCDESSMIALDLADNLLSACPNDMQVVLVGDVDQLPSVGSGSVLRDVIQSGAVPVVRLEYVYRQEEGSGISLAAHQVNAGEMPTLKDLGEDVVSVEVQSSEEAAEAAVRYAKQAYDRYGLLGFGVLSPMKKGVSGVNALNEKIRDALNPAHSTQGIGLGDKVAVLKNDYAHEVFNGDLGVVVDVAVTDGHEVLRIDFGDKFLEFCYEAADGDLADYADPKILQLAFASTIHRVQGSEFPVSIVVLTRSHIHMAQKQLLYTAMTRAKKRLVIIHEQGVVRHAARNDRIAQRNSRLAQRLKGGVAHV